MNFGAEKFTQSLLKGRITNDVRPKFLSVFKNAVLQSPEKDAVIFEDNGIKNFVSFQYMDNVSNKIANFLYRYNHTHKLTSKVVVVALKPSEQLPVILLAILKAGMVYLPLDLESPIGRIDFILRETSPAMCIVHETADPDKFQGVPVFSEKKLIDEAKLESDVLTFEADDLEIAIVLYTSGSTGFPKGVKLSYSALMNRLYWQWTELPYKPTETICVSKTALTFVDSVCEIWGPLLQSRTLLILPKHVTENPEKFIGSLEKYKIQRIVLVPSLLKSMMIYLHYQQDNKSLAFLHLWICSGETLPTSLVKDFFLWFNTQEKMIANLYGSTEIMGDVTYYLIKNNDQYLNKMSIPIGRPIHNNIIYIVDESMKLVPNGEIGEMLVAGKNLAIGYISDSGFQKKFIDNPFTANEGFSKVFCTGDLAKIEDSIIFYEGRQDSQIKIRGQKLDLTEIERAVLELPLVEEVVVCCKSDEHQQVILCFVVLKNFINKKKEIEIHLSQTLLPYMMPKIFILEKFPLLTNGKVDRQRLLESYDATNKTDTQKYDFSDVPEEHRIKAQVLFPLLSSVIGQHEQCISIHSNFYELGGNSLNSIYTVSKLREEGFSIGITDFITADTMMDILVKMKKGGYSKEEDINPNNFSTEMLKESHQNDVVKMITESFLTKADLERWLLPHIDEKDYDDFVKQLWKPLLKKNLSFVIKSSADNRVLAVSLNFDARDEPEINISSKLSVIFDFLEFLEKPIRDTRLPAGKNKIFHSFMMATDIKLDSASNVILMRMMEQKCLEIARQRSFSGILTTNTSPLTQQLGSDVFNYTVLLDYQVNQYMTTDQIKPFEKAPDHQRAIVSWKKIE